MRLRQRRFSSKAVWLSLMWVASMLFVVHGTVPVPGTYPMPPHPELFMPGSLSGAIIGGGRRLLILREEIPKLLEPGQLGSVLNGG